VDSFVAWVVLPAALLALSHGLGSLLAAVARIEPPAALLAPVGAGLAVVVALAGYVAGLSGVLTPLVLVALALSGWVLAIRGRRIPRPGLGALVWLAAYALYLAPVALTGHWTWLGYNFVNDTSVQLLLANWLPEHGRSAPGQLAFSTTWDVISSYLATGYPLGSHALLGAVQALIPVRMEALYQPFIATFAGLTAVALWMLARRVTGPVWAAFAAIVATASNLLFQYSLQGNLKEIVTASLLAIAAAVAGWSLAALRDAEPAQRPRVLTGSAVLIAAPVAGVVNVLSTAGGPYVALLIALWCGLLFAHRLVPSARAFATALIAGTAATAAFTVGTLSTLTAFGQSTTQTYAARSHASDLGHLARPLEVRQTAGIWLTGDYRYAPEGLGATLTDLAIPFAVLLAVIAAAWFLRRRRFDVLLFALPAVAIMLVVTPRVSPYADAKTYMLMAPGVTLLAALGAAALARWRAPVGWLAAAALALAVVGSDALAYHTVQYAPTKRMDALRDLDRRLAGKGLILFNEPEEFAKNFMNHTQLNVAGEAITPAHPRLRVPQGFGYLWFDLDDQMLDYVEEYPNIVLRRSPAASRPPANYRMTYRNAYYEVWRREARPEVVDHLPLQALDHASVEPSCQDVTSFARKAKPGERIVAAAPAATVRLDPLQASRTASWRPHPYRAGRLVTDGPGRSTARVDLEQGGRYRAWIAGTFGRAVYGLVDGEEIGFARGVNTVGQWHDIGTVALQPGPHELELRRGGGSAAPGDGYSGELGPLVLERVGPRPLVSVRPKDAERRLCGRQWDWIERIAP
jgi:hypothetical protein